MRYRPGADAAVRYQNTAANSSVGARLGGNVVVRNRPSGAQGFSGNRPRADVAVRYRNTSTNSSVVTRLGGYVAVRYRPSGDKGSVGTVLGL